ncbi:hypothetical protein ILYODFUR_030524 [Ilyodon furcidens]|uniref:Secreted protein n=1 Tax=Ilyodon furcidens TaxID=33524 RepID=A0ABV0VII2_9TELE
MHQFLAFGSWLSAHLLLHILSSFLRRGKLTAPISSCDGTVTQKGTIVQRRILFHSFLVIKKGLHGLGVGGVWVQRIGLVGNWAKKQSFDLLCGGQAGLGTPAPPLTEPPC